MKKTIISATLILFTFSSLAQLNWQKGGNNLTGGGVATIGTDGSWNSSLTFLTFGTGRMTLTTTNQLNMIFNNSSFQIAGQNVLWHKGNPRNIFVGVGAGNNHLGPAGNNSYVGSNAGLA